MAWIAGNYYLSRAQMAENVTEIYRLLRRAGWSKNAIAALCGNMEAESTINPGIWENLSQTTVPDVSRGYGLVQWTPWNKYADWSGPGWENNGPRQVQRILYEVENNIQWFENPLASSIGMPYYPPITFAEFSTSSASLSYLSDCFICYYEHPASLAATYQTRRTNAAYWRDFIAQLPDPGPGPSGRVPLWLLFKLRDNNRR